MRILWAGVLAAGRAVLRQERKLRPLSEVVSATP